MDILGSNLAETFALQLSARNVEEIQIESNKQVDQGSFKLLDVLHHFTSGFKAYSTETSYYGIDKLRQACGGAGFLLSSGLADWWGDIAPYPTFEGVNVVMFQQSSRMLFKNVKKVRAGKTPRGLFAYLGKKDQLE